MPKQLIDYLPPVIREIKKHQNISEAEQPEFDLLWVCLLRALNDGFIHDATEYGISRWESMLEITPKISDTLEIRRERVLIRLKDKRPYTYRVLEMILRDIFGNDDFSLNLKHLLYLLQIELGAVNMGMFNEIKEMLLKIIPANIILELATRTDELTDTIYAASDAISIMITELPEAELPQMRRELYPVTYAWSIMTTTLREAVDYVRLYDASGAAITDASGAYIEVKE